jgi:hypothetical protein
MDCQFGAGTCALKACTGYFQQEVPDVTGNFSLVLVCGDSNCRINDSRLPDWHWGHSP